MENLKRRIRDRGCSVYDYDAEWGGVVDGKPLASGLETFREKVLNDLWNAICKEFPEEEPKKLTLVDIEKSYHQSFIESRAKHFIGRTELLQQIHKYVTRHQTIVLSGKPGSGKSALVAKFIEEYTEKNPRAYVISHFVGASPGSTDIRRILWRVSSELVKRFKLDTVIPEDYKEMRQAFISIVEQASFLAPIVIVIDALDQLSKSNSAHSLDWLPRTLPIKLVLSSLEGPVLDVLRRRKTPEVTVGPLNLKEKASIVRETLAIYRKKLDEKPMNDQMRPLLKKMDSDKPLYLIMACHELRLFGIYEQLSERIKTLPMTVGKLMEEVLQRLETDHGKQMVSSVFGYICCSRGGIEETVLLTLLARKEKKEPELPKAIWSSLYSNLQDYLRPSGDNEGTLDFFHQEMVQIVKKKYLDREEQKYHQRLAEHYWNEVFKDGNWNLSAP